MSNLKTPFPHQASSAWFPLFTNLYKSPVLLIGGDEVAVRKARRLIAAGAQLNVIATELAPELTQWQQEGRLNWVGKQVTEDSFAGHLLIMVADRKSTRLNSSHVAISYAVF